MLHCTVALLISWMAMAAAVDTARMLLNVDDNVYKVYANGVLLGTSAAGFNANPSSYTFDLAGSSNSTFAIHWYNGGSPGALLVSFRDSSNNKLSAFYSMAGWKCMVGPPCVSFPLVSKTPNVYRSISYLLHFTPRSTH